MKGHHLHPHLLLALLAAPLPIAGQAVDLDRLEAVADSVAQLDIANDVTPGLTVAVGHGGRIIFERGYGAADVENRVAAAPETVYRIGSITKQFTSAAVMRLVEQGRIRLADPITSYLSEYPTQGHTVTIHHLLNHTSGIRSYTGLGPAFWEEKARLDLTDQELVDLFDELPFDFAPGEKQQYNNSAYYLLGMILGEVGGGSYPEYIETALLEPLGLEHTLYCDNRRIVPNRAEGYDYADEVLVNAEPLSMNVPGAAGALCSTAGDLVKWTWLLHTGEVVSPASFERMTTPTPVAAGDTVPYGYGLGLGELEGHRKVHHGGGIHGFISYLAHYPDADLTIAVLTNSGRGDPDRIENRIARAALGLPLPGVADIALAEDELRRYEGSYVLDLGARELELQVFGEDGGLRAQGEGQPVTTLRYQGDDVFVPDFDEDARLVFEMEDGRAVGVTLHQGGGEVSGRRVQ